MQIAAIRKTHAKELFKLLGVGELYDQFPKPGLRIKHTDEINAMIKPLIAAQPSQHWLDELGKVGIPCAPIQTLDQVAAEPQFDHPLILTQIQNPQDSGKKSKIVSASHVAEPAPQEYSDQRQPWVRTTTKFSQSWATALETSRRCVQTT